MLIGLGAKRGGGDDGVELLLACHDRIRRFAAMARRLAEARGRPDTEIRETAAQIRRYFVEALPLHVRDEEDTIAALLAGHDREVDAALAVMVEEHGDHEPAIARLVAICAALEDDPRQLAALAVPLGPLAAALETDLIGHLEREERIVFPALRALPDTQRAALLRAIRERRAGRPELT